MNTQKTGPGGNLTNAKRIISVFMCRGYRGMLLGI